VIEIADVFRRFANGYLSAHGATMLAYFGHRFETADTQVRALWVADVNTRASGSIDAMALASDYLRKISRSGTRIGATYRGCRNAPRTACARPARRSLPRMAPLLTSSCRSSGGSL
jgi:hypothetical protein